MTDNNNDIMETKDYNLSIITAAVAAGFEYDFRDPLIEIEDAAENFLLEDEPYGKEFVRTDFDESGNGSSYTFLDEGTGFTRDIFGEVFDFGHGDHYYHRKPDGPLEPVDWFDVPAEGPERKDYAFVFAKHPLSNGKVAYLFDFFD